MTKHDRALVVIAAMVVTGCAGPGWFRGVEDREHVGPVQAPAQPVEASEDARMSECWRRYLVGSNHSRDHVTAYNRCLQR